MITAPYRDNKPYDEYLEKTFTSVSKHIVEKNDDFLCITVGVTGTGKSTLNLHILDVAIPENLLDISMVAMSREELAQTLKSVATRPKPRAANYDEANVNKRDSMTQWNKDILDLYLSCRGLNILHLWANPTLNLIDKSFIEDRIRAVILVRGKDKRIRHYYFFRKKDILAIYRKYNTLSIDVISRVRKKYAWYKGWFKDYNGKLKEDYLAKKENRMLKKVEQFFDKYADDDLSKRSEVIKQLGISDETAAKYTKLLDFGTHYEITATGRYKYTKEGVEQLRKLLTTSGRKRGLML